MRDAEEVARDMYAVAEQTYDDLRELGPKMGPGKMRERMIYAIATHLRARDAEVRADERAKVRYVVFDSDWCEPPGDVIAVFATEAEARAHIDGPGDGYGWSVVEVPAP